MFPSELTEDPLLARSDRLIRCGAAVPMMGFAALALTARLFEPSRSTFVLEMLLLSLAAQTLIWWGVFGVWRTAGWESGVLFYLWFGGLLGGLALVATAIPAVIPVPFLAPAVATLARWRAVRRARRAAGAEA